MDALKEKILDARGFEQVCSIMREAPAESRLEDEFFMVGKITEEMVERNLYKFKNWEHIPDAMKMELLLLNEKNIANFTCKTGRMFVYVHIDKSGGWFTNVTYRIRIVGLIHPRTY